ncbi:hypothetical protein IPZ58_07640 [Streptomyces roseoverticillatus]|uniref:hypothetical protein n=1 Tax=Streptomyces roseoverticillatus TaxID=66429 RepID=UPI001F25F2F4|nr:hypothetical protein [Streptomyces roseoverticillatus]MCF3101452.1 hypothetical protein [Streptomyces roseoverticillatus]
MNLLALRSLIGNALAADESVETIEYVNPYAADGRWALRAKVADDTSGTRVFRIDITEE